MTGERFRKCGHPATPENSFVANRTRSGEPVPGCRFCRRVRLSRLAIDRQIERWRKGPTTLGRKIAEGLL